MTQIATAQNLKKRKYLGEIKDGKIDDASKEVTLLIGGNYVKVLEQREVIPSQDGGPCSFRLTFDWYIVGPMQYGKRSDKLGYNRIFFGSSRKFSKSSLCRTNRGKKELN